MDASLRVLNLLIVKERGENIPGLIYNTVPCHSGPQKTRRIYKHFNLSEENNAH